MKKGIVLFKYDLRDGILKNKTANAELWNPSKNKYFECRSSIFNFIICRVSITVIIKPQDDLECCQNKVDLTFS